MTFDEMTVAIDTAAYTLRCARRHAGTCAELAAGQLRAAWNSGDVSCSTLAELKRELRDFDSRSGRFK